jgi:hypothetical protein
VSFVDPETLKPTTQAAEARAAVTTPHRMNAAAASVKPSTAVLERAGALYEERAEAVVKLLISGRKRRAELCVAVGIPRGTSTATFRRMIDDGLIVVDAESWVDLPARAAAAKATEPEPIEVLVERKMPSPSGEGDATTVSAPGDPSEAIAKPAAGDASDSPHGLDALDEMDEALTDHAWSVHDVDWTDEDAASGDHEVSEPPLSIPRPEAAADGKRESGAGLQKNIGAAGAQPPSGPFDWRESARREYVGVLLGTLRSFDQAAVFPPEAAVGMVMDRVERALGIAAPAGDPMHVETLARASEVIGWVTTGSMVLTAPERTRLETVRNLIEDVL